MKAIILLVGLGLLTIAAGAGCEEEHEHHHGYGGAYDDNYRGYGHGDYRGWPEYNPGYNNYDYYHH